MSKAVLAAEGLAVGYGGRPVLDGISIELRANEVLCLIGHNGAGKSTLLKALFGLLPCQRGRVLLDGQPLPRHEPRALTAAGVSLMPEGRGVFPDLTVAETLKLALWAAAVWLNIFSSRRRHELFRSKKSIPAASEATPPPKR